MYSGHEGDEYNRHLTTLTNSADTLNTVLVRRDVVYTAVHKNFPRTITHNTWYSAISDAHSEREREIVTNVQNVIDAINFFNNAELDRSAATREEQDVLSTYDNIKGFAEILQQRIITCEAYNVVMAGYDLLHTHEVNMDVQVDLISFLTKQGQEKDDKRAIILDKSTLFNRTKNQLGVDILKFRDECATLTGLQNSVSNLRFLNEKVLQSTPLDAKDRTMSMYLTEQEDSWKQVLVHLIPAPPVSNPTPDPGGGAGTGTMYQGYREHLIFTAKHDILKSIIDDYPESVISTLGIEECKTLKAEVVGLRDKLRDLMSEPGVIVSNKEGLDLSRPFISKLDNHLENSLAVQREKEDRRKHETQANIRALGTVKLMNLTGFADYLQWRKSQQNLNSHTDPFKKASLLLSTLKNPEDQERCEGNYDYDDLMAILKQKYGHQEKLIPAMLNRLRKLPEPQTNVIMLKNIGIILNIHCQLKSLGEAAISKFDGTVIEDLILKLTEPTQIEYERHLMSSESDDSEDESKVSSVNSIPGADLLSLRGGPDDTKKKRIKFIRFIKKEESLLRNLMARKTNLSASSSGLERPKKPPCAKCKKHKCICKSRVSAKATGTAPAQGGGKQCPVCKSYTKHVNRKGYASDSLRFCKTFRQMPLEERTSIVETLQHCTMCLSPGHTEKDCHFKGGCLKLNCNLRHSGWLCPKPMPPPSTTPDKVEVRSTHTIQDKVSFSAVSGGHLVSESSVHQKALIFFDSGSTGNFIREDTAKKLGYRPMRTKITLERLGVEDRTLDVNMYYVRAMANDGSIVKIHCYGTKKVGTRNPMPKADLNNMSRLFNVQAQQINNFHGEIDLLIGTCNYSLFPSEIKRKGDIALLKSYFGKPYLVIGNIGCGQIRNGEHRVSANRLVVSSNKFFETDQLGINADPKCDVCLKAPECKACSALSHPQSFKEQTEGRLLKSSMTFDYQSKEVRVSYPFLQDVREIFSPDKSNEKLALKMAENLRKGLIKDNILESYTDNFLDMETRGVIRELSPEECQEWEAGGNPINYCSHHAVLKESKTTKVRVVCNSSLSHNGTTLNEMLPKGPNALTNLLHVMMRFRAKPYAVTADITKAYWTIKTGPIEEHLRRFLWWRQEDLEKTPLPPPRQFGMCRMTFGDRPAQYYLELAKLEIANHAREKGWHELADIIISSSYVDDVCPSFETREEAEKFKELLPKAFEVLGFKFKEIEIVGPSIEPEAEAQHMFGHIYHPKMDDIQVKFTCNFSNKKRGQKSSPDLTSKSDLSSLILTKRSVLGMAQCQYDPLGLASPFLAKVKIFMSKLHKKYDWDTPLAKEDAAVGMKIVKELIEASESSLKFPRRIKPEGFDLKRLVCFSDGSSVAFCTVLYGVFENSNGDVCSSLLTSKMRIASQSVPRNELDGLVASHRLVRNYLQAVDHATLKSIDFLVDSTCILDFLNPNYYTKDVYVVNRVVEIRKSINGFSGEGIQTSYSWIPTETNVSDQGTRENCKFSYLSSNEWQEGPEFIRNLDHDNPGKIVHSFEPEDRVQCNAVHHVVSKQQVELSVWQKLLLQTNSIMKVLRTYCIVKNILKGKKFKFAPPSVRDLEDAFLFFVRISQEEIPIENLKTKQLVVFQQDGISYTKLRFTEESMALIFKRQQLPVLSGKCRLAKLLLIHAHTSENFQTFNGIHHSQHQTLVNSRVGKFGCYITHAKQNIKGLVGRCVVCRRLNKRVQDAKMDSRKGGFATTPSDGSAFNKIALDYFGPMFAKPPKSKQTRSAKPYKIFGVAMICQQTRAIKVYPVEGYDTESFMIVFRNHCANHGVPSEIVSDPMKAFVKAARVHNEVENNEEDLESKSEIEDLVCKNFNLTWNLIPPGSQWRDPAERAIKSIKLMMKSVFNTDKDHPVLTMGEYYTLFAEISEILNRRPIEAKVSESALSFICPNDLIIGRGSKYQPLSLPDELSVSKRLQLIESIKSMFWKEYIQVLAGNSHLLKYPTWYKQSRKPSPNDVILVLYKTRVSEGYRIAKILKVDDEGRNLEVLVSPHQSGISNSLKAAKILRIPTQRTILLYSAFDDKDQSQDDCSKDVQS